MDPAMIAGAVLSVLSLIEQVLPQLGVAGNSVTMVDTIITALVKFVPVIQQLAPLAGNEVKLIYQGMKNIIANIRGTDTTEAQDAALDALDAQVDAAWDAVAPKFDPDYVPPSAGT